MKLDIPTIHGQVAGPEVDISNEKKDWVREAIPKKEESRANLVYSPGLA